MYTPGYIYFAKSDSLLKVGFTTDPKRRIKTHKSSNPRFELLAVLISYKEVETLIHLKYKSVYLKEWHNLEDYLDITQDVINLTTKIIMGNLL